MYDQALTIDLTNIPFTQSPPCDYPATEDIRWTNPEPLVILENPLDKRILSVFSVDKSKLGTHTMVITNTISYDGGEWSPSYTFDIEIVDPCEQTVLLTQAIDTLTTDNGVVGTVDFSEVQD